MAAASSYASVDGGGLWQRAWLSPIHPVTNGT